MILRTTLLSFTSLTLLAFSTSAPAYADNLVQGAAMCGGGHGTVINKHITINKPVTVNKNIKIFKPITVNKNINIYKPINVVKKIDLSKNININKNIQINKNFDLSKKIEITKNIDVSKKIEINKNINIQKNVDVDVSAHAFAFASAAASAQAATVIRGGSSHVTVVQRGGEVATIAVAQEQCVYQWANVVKSINAVCVDKYQRTHPAVRMRAETWLDANLESEIYRCLPGSAMKVTIGDVVNSSAGLAGGLEQGQQLECYPGEALRHYRGGALRCAPAEDVTDCTERDAMRRNGVGTYFFSYPYQVCVPPGPVAALPPLPPPPAYPVTLPKTPPVIPGKTNVDPPIPETLPGEEIQGFSRPTGEVQLSGMSLDGGVGAYQ
jgi:hypothetical protein